jgi:hypothetical protein
MQDRNFSFCIFNAHIKPLAATRGQPNDMIMRMQHAARLLGCLRGEGYRNKQWWWRGGVNRVKQNKNKGMLWGRRERGGRRRRKRRGSLVSGETKEARKCTIFRKRAKQETKQNKKEKNQTKRREEPLSS